MKSRKLVSVGASTAVAAGLLAGGITLSTSGEQIKPTAGTDTTSSGQAADGTTSSGQGTGGRATADSQAPNRYTILKNMTATGNNRAARTVPLRRGYYKRSSDNGFGYAKAALKHGFTKTTQIAKMTKVASWQHVSGTSYNLTITVREWTCDSKGGCKIKKAQKVLQVVDLRLARGKPMGLVTMFCPGTGVHCPPWVMKSFECPQIHNGVPCSAHGKATGGAGTGGTGSGGGAAVPAKTIRYDMVPGTPKEHHLAQ